MNILVPIDFSVNSENALSFACDLVTNPNTKITVFHSYPLQKGNPIQSIDSIIELEKSAEQEAKIKLSNFLQIFLHKRVGHQSFEIIPLTRLGFAVENIIYLTETHNFELIVMGTKGANDVKTKLLGTNTACVMDNVHCPVFAIPSNAKFTNFDSIVFASDLNDFRFSESSILVEIAKSFNSKIYLAHIVKESEKSSPDELSKLLDLAQYQLGYNNIKLVEMTDDNLDDKLDAYVQGCGAAALVLTVQQRNIFQKMFYPNLQNELFYHANLPLLSLHT